MKIAIIRDHPRCAASTQLAAVKVWGCPDGDIWHLGAKDGHYSWRRVLDPKEHIVRAGDTVGVYHLWLIPQQGSKARTRPGDQMREIAELMLDGGVRIEEISTGRTCDNKADLLRMYDDALRAFSRRSGTNGGRPGGRPKIHDYGEDWDLIDLIFNNKEFINDAQRVADVRRRGAKFAKFNAQAYRTWKREQAKSER